MLHHIGRHLRRVARQHFQPYGLTPAQVRALRTVAAAETPLRMSTLAEQLGVVRRSATDLVEVLVAAGMVERRPDPTDGRAVVVAATPAGNDLLTTIAAARRRASTELLRTLSPAERQQLTTLLRRMVAP